MRDFGKVPSRFWMSKEGKAVKGKGLEAVIVAMYLKTCPASNMLGLYYLLDVAMGVETGLGLDGARKGLSGCMEAQYCDYDTDSMMVWVYDMAAEQIGVSLKATDLQCKGVQREYDSLPENRFLAPFYDRYAQAFNMTNRREVEPIHAIQTQAPSEALGSQEKNKEQAKPQDKEQPKAKGVHPPALREGATVKSQTGSEIASGKERPVSAIVWDHYSAAFQTRYGVEPTRNAKVNGQLAQFVTRVPKEEAPLIAAFYVSMDKAFYVSKLHSVDFLLSDAEAIRAQFQTGKTMTHTQSREVDRRAASNGAFAKLLEAAEARESGAGLQGEVFDVESREVL